VVVFAALAGVMTSVMSNTATANLLIPVVLNVSGGLLI
jgi:di/tricarboxylate transporter